MPYARDPLILALAGLLGLVVGSFLNVCIYRLPRKLSIAYPPSFCPSCERCLAFWELVPLLSYLVLGGRCRSCRARISPVYPLVEGGTAILYLAAVAREGLTLDALSLALFGSLLIVCGGVDAGHRIIPDVVSVPGIVLGLGLSAFRPPVGVWSALIGLLIGGGFLFLVAILTDGGMGGGDIKLGAMMGAFLGWSGVLVALLLGFVSGALAGGLLLVTGKKKRRDPIAFGPFLAAGGLAAALWAPGIIGWYVSTLVG